MDQILNGGEFNLQKIIYANGPGSFMGVKVAYVVLKTISIVKECEFYAVSGFELNGGAPIRANKNLSFVDTPEGIKLQKAQAGEFCLPQNLAVLNLNLDTLPNYVIQAV
ncbi:glycoprotease [Campylobacter rectus]|nr:glycoprotease [Campylobacter rectus]